MDNIGNESKDIERHQQPIHIENKDKIRTGKISHQLQINLNPLFLSPQNQIDDFNPRPTLRSDTD